LKKSLFRLPEEAASLHGTSAIILTYVGTSRLEVSLAATERQGLEKLVHRHNTSQQKALRGKIILLAAAGKSNSEIVISTDEMTGVQAIERKHPGLPMAPGNVERIEFDYIRHGTLSFIVNFEVDNGKIATISYGSTRNEKDFAEHIRLTVERYPTVSKWHFIVDNLKILQSDYGKAF